VIDAVSGASKRIFSNFRRFEERAMTIALVRKRQVLFGMALVAIALVGGQNIAGQGALCGMMRNDAPVVFCDTFDSPFPVTNRSGQLDGTVWGTSRLNGGDSTWLPADLDTCNGSQHVSPPNDVIVCNGRLRESTNDGGGVTVLALYPKQPFDWAGRTGTVSFDVTNDTSGTHGAWPEFWISDLPVPAPFTHALPCDFCSVPRHALGIRFGAPDGDCPGGWRADSVVVVRNYVVEDRHIFENNTTGTQIRQTGCASKSSGPNGALNHVEIRVSQNQVELWSSDAGNPASLRRINTITNANLSFTRGLIWIQDVHYNASKSPIPSHTNHTFTWDNVAFDGPATYRDLSYDVLDRNVPANGGRVNLGWDTTPSSPANLTTLPMTAQAIAGSTRALLMFNFGVYSQISTFNYSINGNAISSPTPLPSILTGQRSVAFEVPLSYLVAGPQNIRLSANQPMIVQNVNIVLVAATPVPGFIRPTAPSNLRIIGGQALNKLQNWAGLVRQTLAD
jgi:hypothetical protein